MYFWRSILLPMNKNEEAVSIFNNGFNCAQAVLSVFASEKGLDRNMALKVATGLGAGLGHQGKICGAVVGAYLSIGLHAGSSAPNDEFAKEITYHMSRKFDREFLKNNPSLICKELLKVDLSTPEGYDIAKEKGLFETLCPNFVSDAVIILEKMFEKKLPGR